MSKFDMSDLLIGDEVTVKFIDWSLRDGRRFKLRGLVVSTNNPCGGVGLKDTKGRTRFAPALVDSIVKHRIKSVRA
jgi:hypothetical protein